MNQTTEAQAKALQYKHFDIKHGLHVSLYLYYDAYMCVCIYVCIFMDVVYLVFEKPESQTFEWWSEMLDRRVLKNFSIESINQKIKPVCYHGEFLNETSLRGNFWAKGKHGRVESLLFIIIINNKLLIINYNNHYFIIIIITQAHERFILPLLDPHIDL